MYKSARHLVMYPHCNSTKNLFGGQLIAWIDEAGALFASCIMQTNHLVTLKMGEIIFNVPVPCNSVLEFYCRTLKQGRTSLTIEVVVQKKDFKTNNEVQVTQTEMVFVATDEQGKPIPWNESSKQKEKPTAPGYHQTEISVQGEYGTASKVLEEIEELEDAIRQKAIIMIQNELSDIWGAWKGWRPDLVTEVSQITSRHSIDVKVLENFPPEKKLRLSLELSSHLWETANFIQTTTKNVGASVEVMESSFIQLAAMYHLTLEDLDQMAELTKRAFENGHRS